MTPYMWAGLAAIIVLVALAILFAVPGRQRIEPSEQAAPMRPYMQAREGKGVSGEVAAATTDVAGEVLAVDAHRALSDRPPDGDALENLKGVGPKLAAQLRELGLVRFAQLADLSEAELERLEARLGAFRGRLARDRVPEQAHYLARGDIDGFEEKFGKLGG